MESEPREISSLQREIIKNHFNIWNSIVESRGKDSEDTEYAKKYRGELDRSNDEHSLFLSDKLIVINFTESMKGYVSVDPSLAVIDDNESWIELTIKPKDPYRPNVADYEHRNYVECLNIYISSEGQSFEATDWHFFWKHDSIPHIVSDIPEMKNHQQEFPVWLLDNDPVEVFFPEPLSSQNMERLRFITIEVQNGNLIDLNP